MKGYKAYEKGLVCKGKQYQENTVFEENEAVVCCKGMHFCENPLDCLDYYPLIDDNGNFTEFTDVEALDDPKTDDNKKFASKKLKIGAKLDLAGFIKASIKFVWEKCTKDAEKSSGYSAKLASSGNYAQLASSGYSAQIDSKGKNAVICCAGMESMARGKIGSWITLSEWKWSDKEDAYIPVCVKTKKIDGVKIKEDTFYMLKGGKFVEV